LIERGADVSQTILGLSPLAHAVDAAIDQSAQCGIAAVPTDIIRLLISAGADLGPGLKVARDYRRRDIIELLEAAAPAG
jgi:hypothetical protein